MIKCILLFVIILMVVSSAEAFAVDNAVVEISFDLNNIAISKDNDSKTVGAGEHINIGDLNLGPLPSGENPKYSAMIKYLNEIKAQSRKGRTVIINWKITNYDLQAGMCKDCIVSRGSSTTDLVDIKAYGLFIIGWNRDRLDYTYLDDEDNIKNGWYMPQQMFVDSPSNATIVGYGDTPVVFGNSAGLSFDIEPKFTMGNLEEVITGVNWKIVRSYFTFPKILFLNISHEKQDQIVASKIQLFGKAALCDTMIVTERAPFWYPFDKYSLNFRYKSFYPADVTFKFQKVEDLDLSAESEIHFKINQGQVNRQNIVLYRNNKIEKNLFPLIIAISPILFMIIDLLLNVTAHGAKRLLTYLLALIALYIAVPHPKNVPLLNAFSLVCILLFVSTIALTELYQRKTS